MAGSVKEKKSNQSTAAAERKIKRWSSMVKRSNPVWKTEAASAQKFYDGDQWSIDDRAFLEESLRPVVTFNRVAPFIDAIIGYQINSRQDIITQPRGPEDTAGADALTEVIRWVRDKAGSEFSESAAFKDALIVGLGWLHVSMDYNRFPGGEIKISRVSPFEVIIDPRSEDHAGHDAKFIARDRYYDTDEVEELWGEEVTMYMTGSEDDALDEVSHPLDANKMWKYQENATEGSTRHLGQVKVREWQWWEYEDVYTIVSPTGDMVEVTEDDLKKNPDLGRGIKRRRRKYYRAFTIGDHVIDFGDNPFPHGFTYIPIIGKREHTSNVYYGIVKAMKDPQDWSNKFFSQLMHTINSSSKGGLMAELDAFDNVRKAESEWAQPNSITWMRPGGLQKVLPKPPPVYPQGIAELLQFATGALREVTGVNLEFLGLANRQQSGVLESQRKESAVNILAPFLDSLRWARIELGRTLVYFVKAYVPEGVVARLGQERAMQILSGDIGREYDIIVEESPASTNLKQRVWGELVPILPMLANLQTPPSILAEFLRFSPLPSEVVDRISQAAQEAEQNNQDPKVPYQIQQMQSDAILNQEKAKQARAKAMLDASEMLNKIYGNNGGENG